MNTQEKTTGDFRPKTKFVEFIGGKGFVNFISNEATIEGKYLSGLEMDGINFKMTIFDDGSVTLDEIDTNQTTKEQRARLLEIIEDKTIGSYRNRSVIQELNFYSVTKVKDKLVPLYLAIEVEKPIDKLSDVLNDTLKATESALHNLENLFSSWMDNDFEIEIDEEYLDSVLEDSDNESFSPPSDYLDNLENSFDRMKSEKLEDLKSNLSKKQVELSKLEFQNNQTTQTIESIQNEIKLIQDRIDDLQPIQPIVGYYFNVSERQNETITLDESTEKIIREKVSKVKSINLDNFMKLFTDGEFYITLAQKTDDGYQLVDDYSKLDDDIKIKLDSFNLTLGDNKLIYMGELTWSQLVNRFIKLGFEENPDFNKFCGSNSYQSNTQSKEDLKNTKTTF